MIDTFRTKGFDRFAKTHPWRATLHRDVPFLHNGEERGTQSKGERMGRTKTEMASFVHYIRENFGVDAVSDVYKVRA